MKPQNRALPLTRQQIDRILGTVLRYGVILSALVIGVGLLLDFSHSRQGGSLDSFFSEITSGKMVRGASHPNTASDFFKLHSYSDPKMIINLGIVLLILLPITRVGLTIFIFLIDRDFIYVGITLFVFSVLLFGLIFGKDI